MRTLVAYMSKTGNTRRVAEAIHGELGCEKEIKSIDSVTDLGAYDLAFLGFPMHQYGPDKKTREFLERNCTKGKKVALFVTHASPEDYQELPEWLAKFRQAAADAEIVGFFNCQGELAKGVKFIMKVAPSKRLRSMAKLDNSVGQPDAGRIERARAFARETLSRCLDGSGS
jgi:flavodoxin